MKSYRKLTIVLMVLCIAGIAVPGMNAKKKPKIDVGEVKNFGVLPFISDAKTETEKETGPIAAEAFATVLSNKKKYGIIPPEKAAELLKAEGLTPETINTPETVKQACAILKVDALLIGKILLYIEKESSSAGREENPSEVKGGANPQSGSGFIENLREVKTEFELKVYRATDGQEAGSLTLDRSIRDTAKDPMMPSSGDILLERCAKWAAKKLAKQLL